MQSILLSYLSRFTSLSDGEAQTIVSQIPVQEFEKGTVLLREGEISTKCWFVLRGCVRRYHLADGVEKTTAFYTEEQTVISLTSYSQQVPSSHAFACVEDCVLVVGYAEAEAAMYAQYPALAGLSRMFVEQDFGKTQDAFIAFMTSSPEERYQTLLRDRPDLLNRVPQHQLASYLGVTPESLSRIRKRIATKPQRHDEGAGFA